MSDWSAGYNVDLGYTYGYYREQDPGWMDLCALLRGLAPPSVLGHPTLRYLELGCGQGVTLCFLAACHPAMEFVGIDFNPQHVAHAERLANAAGLTNVRFLEADFATLGRDWPRELGQFHYASAHGIYTWIAPEVARGLVRCLEHGLAPGGLFYVSYNVMPGWLSTVPVQHLLRLWQVREELPSARAIDLGRERLKALIDAGVGMAGILPGMKFRLEKFPQLDKAYLVQEYLHDNWRPLWFDQLEKELAPAKLRYIGTVAPNDWFLAAMLPEKAKAILNQYQDPIEREVMIDVLVNQSFRRDLWARGQLPVWPTEQRERLLGLRFAFLSKPRPRDDGESPYRYVSSLGELVGKPEAYEPLYAALESGSRTVSELMAAQPGRTVGDTLQALGLMYSAGHIAVHRPVSDAKPARALNRAVAEAALAGAPYRFQIATALNHVLQIADTDMMLIALWNRAPKLATVDSLSTQLVDRLLELGRGLKDGERSLNTRDEMLARARALAEAFLDQTMPRLQRLGVLGS